MTNTMNNALLHRRGAVLIAALVCLLVVMSLLGSMLLGTLRRTRQLHAERDLRQCELLLQAGVDQAWLQSAAQPDYAGETREFLPTEIIHQGAGRLTIVVQPATTELPRQLKITAEYPAGDEFSIRRSRIVPWPTATTLKPTLRQE